MPHQEGGLLAAVQMWWEQLFAPQFLRELPNSISGIIRQRLSFKTADLVSTRLRIDATVVHREVNNKIMFKMAILPAWNLQTKKALVAFHLWSMSCRSWKSVSISKTRTACIDLPLCIPEQQKHTLDVMVDKVMSLVVDLHCWVVVTRSRGW